MALGIGGEALAWHYGAFLACHLVTGVGAALIPPNGMAAIADAFPTTQRGRPMSLLISASFLGPVLALPGVALLGELGGWRLPIGVVGGLCVVVWGLSWVWWPQQAPPPGQPIAFVARFAAVSRRAGIWHVLGANALYQAAACGLFTYLAALLIRTYGMRTGDTALPLALT